MLRRAPVEVPVERDPYDGWLAAGGDWPPAAVFAYFGG
jgi:hypothetical protein